MQLLGTPGASGSIKKVARKIARKISKKARKKGTRAVARVSDKRLVELVATGLHSFIPRDIVTGLFIKGGRRSKPSKTEEYVVSWQIYTAS